MKARGGSDAAEVQNAGRPNSQPHSLCSFVLLLEEAGTGLDPGAVEITLPVPLHAVFGAFGQ